MDDDVRYVETAPNIVMPLASIWVAAIWRSHAIVKSVPIIGLRRVKELQPAIVESCSRVACSGVLTRSRSSATEVPDARTDR